MNASRLALAGLSLGMVFLGLLPGPDPLSPVEQGPILSRGQLASGASSSESPAALSEGIVIPSKEGAAKAEPPCAPEVADPPEVGIVPLPQCEAGTAARAAPDPCPGDPAGQLRLAESRLEEMLASWRASAGGHARGAQDALRQPDLDDFVGLTPETRLNALAALVSYGHVDRDPLHLARAGEESGCPTRGVVAAVCYHAAVPAVEVEQGRGVEEVASDAPRTSPARTPPALSPLTRCRIAVHRWVARRLGLAGKR